MSAVSTTTVLECHAFDCYVELLHNGNCVARAFGEAKNYELLSGHFKTFEEWLKDVNPPFNPNKTPPDLAFMIAPSCPELLQRKLELKNIQFIKADKKTVVNPIETNEFSADNLSHEPTTETESSTESSQPSRSTYTPYTPTWTFSRNVNAVDINKANSDSLIAAFKGTGVYKTTIIKLIMQRPYKDLDELASKLKFTQAVKTKLKKKLDDGDICF